MASYYSFVRREIEPLLPKNVATVLDVGAGGGSTLGWLRTVYPFAEMTGVEKNPSLRAELESNADVAICDTIDNCAAGLGRFDLVLMLDVLEHVPDSAETLRKVCGLLNSGGHIIVSLPNVSHLSVALPLLVNRRFDYRDAGILDKTHLRFFVEDTAVKLLNDANLIVRKGLVNGLQGPTPRILDHLSFGMLRHHLTKQYIMLGEQATGGDAQGRIKWEVAQ
jgi:2-polyprenyl-3-methyl-5-hydroxy-6-metoxy-1,4-benzoquinol methylase